MVERRPSNSELRLRRLTAAEQDESPRGILELFPDGNEQPADADAPLAREAGDSEQQ